MIKYSNIEITDKIREILEDEYDDGNAQSDEDPDQVARVDEECWFCVGEDAIDAVDECLSRDGGEFA